MFSLQFKDQLNGDAFINPICHDDWAITGSMVILNTMILKKIGKTLIVYYFKECGNKSQQKIMHEALDIRNTLTTKYICAFDECPTSKAKLNALGD